MKSILGFTAVVSMAALMSCGGKGNTVETKDQQQVAQVTPLTKSFDVDVTNSTLGWKGSKVSSSHNGTISVKNGTIGVENDQIKSGNFVIDMTTIKDQDLTDADAAAKLVGHLSAADFFDVTKYPESKFEITGAEKLASVDSLGNNYKIMGNLTIKEITKNITIPANVSMDSTQFSAKSKFSIDRTEWKIEYGSGKFFKGLGDKMINDAIEFDLNLKAVPKK